MYYALEEAAQLLQVKQITLNKWLQDAGITLQVLDTPVLSDDQLCDLARRHKRTLPRRSAGYSTLAAHTREIRALKLRIEHIEAALQGYHPGDWEDDRDSRTRVLEHAVNGAIDFLAGAAHQPGPRQEPILMTFFGKEDVFDQVPRLRSRWLAALRAALDSGWAVIQLHDGKPGPAASTLLVENLISLLGASGIYDPAYADLAPITSPPCEYILVPQRGVCKLTIPQSNELASCDVLSDGPEREKLFRTLEQLAARCRKLLTRTIPNAVGFSEELAGADDQKGNRCLIMDGLSEVHIPFEIYDVRSKTLEQMAETAGDFAKVNQLPQLYTIRQRREEAFETELQHFRVRDICTRRAILRLIQEGIFSPTDRLQESGVLTKSQQAAVLEGLAARLEAKGSHYQLAVLEDKTVARLYPRMRRLFWMVKEGHIVLMEMLHDVGARRNVEVDISITDVDLVKAFYNYFENTLWRQIPTYEKDRSRIAKWLRQEARTLWETERSSPARDGRAGEL